MPFGTVRTRPQLHFWPLQQLVRQSHLASSAPWRLFWADFPGNFSLAVLGQAKSHWDCLNIESPESHSLSIMFPYLSISIYFHIICDAMYIYPYL